jgi:peptidoglycan hydrolase-like protein with peptidoglycan-binding domain
MAGLNLSVGTFGDEVKDLHRKLTEHGFDISPAEVERKFFGPATREAVRECQKEHGLPATGVVDETTNAAIDTAIATKRTAPSNPLSAIPTGSTVARRGNTDREVIATPNKITFPLDLLMQGPKVGDLQAALQLLLDRGVIPVANEDERRGLSAGLQREHAGQNFHEITHELVERFQKQRGLDGSGAVNEPTANAINALLREWGLLEQPDAPRSLVVCGQVQREDGLPFKGGLVRAFHETERGAIRLGEDTTDTEGRYTIRYDTLPEVTGIHLRVSVSSEDGTLLQSSELIRDARPLEIVNLTVPLTEKPAAQRRIEGRIVLEHGLPAENITLRLYRRDFGSAETLLSETTTRADGLYALPYDVGGKAASLEVRAVDAAGREIPLSKTLHDLSEGERGLVNLVAPTALQPLAAEYQRLTDDLTPRVGEMMKLADARENAEFQDLTLLNRATGWDARLLALASNAATLSADAGVGLSQEVLYGLFRAGLPSDKLQLARVSVEAVDQALTKVREAGIINLSAEQVAQVKRQFETFSRETRLAVPAPGSRSTYSDLLKASGLNEEARTEFASLYLNHRGDGAQLWKKAAESGIGPDDIQALQRQGKLAFLAGNSEGMTAWLMQKQMNDPVQLVDQDFHRPDAWLKEVFEQAEIPENRRNNLTDADRQKLEGLIPTTHAAEKVEDRLNAYAEDMARKVRLSYPTQVVGHMVEQDTADTFKLGTARPAATTLLKNAAAKGFRLGQTPVESFVRDHPEVVNGIDAHAIATAQQGLKTLQRVYQITPSNEAVPVLLSLGLTSAYDVVALSQDVFLERYGHKFPSREQATLVHRKAQQVSSVAYNLFTIAKKLDSEAPVYGMSAPVEVRESVKNELIKQFPTMESLFGSLDFCECEHCRSVLSPAAYLVDLLQFVDAEPEVWGNFLVHWKEKHNDQDYTAKYKKPYDALIERRPDLRHIPLTCENTHTALPYIDVVNEILEYYVANDKLDDRAAHDTGDATTAELLAEPQNVIREAYDELQQAHYPLNLPFDLWLETVRQFCNHFETPLWRLLEAFRPDDALFAPAQPYDREHIFIESLGLSPAENAIFTDPDPLGNNKWYELYGLPPVRPAIQNPANVEHATLAVANDEAKKFREGLVCTYFDVSATALSAESKMISAIGTSDSGGAGQTIITCMGVWTVPPDAGDLLVCDALATLKSAKTLSRHLGVTYKEIVEIVETGFVNPRLTELVILYKLGLDIQDVHFYKDHQAFYEQNKDLLGKERSALSAADQQRFDDLSMKNPTTKKTGWEDLNEVQAFEQRLADLTEAYSSSGFDAKAWLNTALQNNAFDAILVLADPDAGCNFDLTTLRYANGQAADAIAFLKINLFVRLWRKLGWTIEETDRALQAFVPKNNTPFDTTHLAQSPLKTTLLYLAHLKALEGQVRVGKQSRLKLITLWSDLPTTGKQPLYAQLFLTRSVLKSDAVFDDALGQYLSPTGLAAMAQLRKHEVQLENVAPADKIDPAPFAAQPKVTLFYDALQEVQHLTYEGMLTDADKAQLSVLSPSPALPTLLDAVQAMAGEFTRIKGHLLALQGALGLTADEIGRILTDAGTSIEDADLSLANVSLLYRYGLLAKALKLSVRELIALKHLSGLDPFKSLHPDPVAMLEEDYPFAQTLRFVEIAGYVKESGLKIEDLDYLLRHHIEDTVGKYRPNSEAALVLMKTLAEGVRAVRAEHAVPDDAGAMGEEVLRQKLGLALPPDVVERFLAMMNGMVEFTATKTGVQSADKLDPEAFKDEPSIREVSHNDKDPLKIQKLTYRGVLFQTEKDRLKALFPSLIFSDLLDDLEKQATQARLFFDNHLQKQKLRLDGEAGFLDDGDFQILFEPLKPLLKIEPGDTQQQIDDKLKENEKIKQENQTTLQGRRDRIARAFLPFLQQRLIRQLIIQTMTAQTGAEPALVEALLSDSRLLGDPQPLLEAFTATGERGVSATFFDGAGAELETKLFADANTGLKNKDGNPLKPAAANSTRFEGYLEVPTPGAYRFYVALDKQDAEAELAELRFEHLPQALLSGMAVNGGAEISEYLELKPGVPYRFTLELRKLNGGEARLLVQGETLPKGSLAQLTLYPLTAVERVERALLLLSKALQLIQSLTLNEREVRYLLAHPADFLSKLPTRESDDSPAAADAARALFTQFLRLAGYARLKRDLAGGTDDLIGIFETKALDQVYPLIARLTRRDEATVKAAANALSVASAFATPLPAAPAFANEMAVQRLWKALHVVERFGAPVPSLVAWTRIVSAAATPGQRFAIARDLKEAIKARFEPETWQRVAQPIFDKLRQRQRDALVAHVMHQHGFARLEQLYEYFLIDPGMEPVVQTSRIRLAISSVQLFIQRCLLNLEMQVHPSVINAKHWEWMKRYRVWEANRKIFLFPENWLEPEFRDDKTHLFNELEGDLLQGDVSSDLVEDAFLNYLKKLEELARLDIVAMHLEDKADPAQNTLHVIGRTFSQPHKYFYRRYAHQIWTSWEPVAAEIEGDHLAPVVWRDRLYLFWVTFMEKAKQYNSPQSFDEPTKKIVIPAVQKEVEVQLHWSEYLQGEWSTRESGGFNSLDSHKIKADLLSNFVPPSVFIHVSKEPYENGEERGVYIHLGGEINRAFYLAGRNSIPEPSSRKSEPAIPYIQNGMRATRFSGSGALTVEFKGRITTEDGKPPVVDPSERPAILYQGAVNRGGEYTLLPCDNNITLGAPDSAFLDTDDPAAVKAAIESGLGEITSLMKPVFYQDNAHTLFIEPSVTERTIEEWQEWVTRTPQPDPEWVLPEWWEDIVVIPAIPRQRLSVPTDPSDPVWHFSVDRASLFKVEPGQDWVVNPVTGLLFDGELIGPGGRAGWAILPSTEVAGAITEGGIPVNVHAGSGLAPGDTVVLTADNALEQAGLTPVAGGLNVVGSSGFNSALAQNFDMLNRSGFGAGNAGAGRIRR